MTAPATAVPDAGRVAAARVGGRRRFRLTRAALVPYCFLLPGIVLLIIFYFWPAFTALKLAFYNYRLLAPPVWAGLDNFRELRADPRFAMALKNSFLFTAMYVPLVVFLPFGLAVLVNQKLRGIQFFRLLYYLPVVTSMVVVAIAWNYVFHQKGILNWLLVSLHILPKPIQYLLDPTWALPALVVVEAWQALGYYMMIYLAGLQSLPEDVVEAARIDGANRWQVLTRITMPLMRPFFSICLIVSAIGSMQVFTSIYIMTQGGPLDHTLTLGYYIYDEAFNKLNMGYAAAMGLVLWLILIVMAFVNYRVTKGGEGTL